MATDSLWPTEFPELSQSGPVKILQAQGEALATLTQGAVKGRVVPFALPGVPVVGPGGEVFAVGGPDRLVHSFQLYVPALDYSYDLLIVSHTRLHYPVDVYRMYEGAEQLGPNPQRAASEDQFVETLRHIFASPAVGHIVQLLKQEAAASPQQ